MEEITNFETVGISKNSW